MAGRDLGVAAIYETPASRDFLYVTRTVGTRDRGLLPPSSPHVERAARHIIHLRKLRKMPGDPGPPAYIKDMSGEHNGEYFFAQRAPNYVDFPPTTPLLGYMQRDPYDAGNGTIFISEAVTDPRLDDDETRAVLGALLLGAMDESDILPTTAIHVHSRWPSGQGIVAMGSLGMQQIMKPSNADFYGHVDTIMPNIDFLGHNLHAAA